MSGVIKFVTQRNINEVIQACKEAEVVGLDTETTALHPKDGIIRLIQLAVRDTVYILDCFSTNVLLLEPLFDGETRFIGHNLAFDLRFLWSVGLQVPYGKNLFCSMIAGQLLDAGILPRKGHSLADMALEYLGIEVDKTYQNSNWSEAVLSTEQLQYAAKDAQILLFLYAELMKRIKNANLERTMQLEMRALPGMVWMTLSGIRINERGWRDLALLNKEKVENLEMALAESTASEDLFGFSTINWRSPAQVTKAFNKKFIDEGRVVKVKVSTPCNEPRCRMFGKWYQDDEGEVVPLCDYHSSWHWEEKPFEIDNTNSRLLAQLAADGDALATILLKYRKTVKSRDTYGIGFLDKYLHTDGRIYPDYHQLGAGATGRMSSSNPNGQNIPHSYDFRSLFIPSSGYKFALADYSQIELRITVELSRDSAGLQAYCVDLTDLHKTTAELILGVNLKDTSEANLKRIKEARQVAKSLNFGLIFGAGSETMRLYAQDAFGVILTAAEAVKLRNAWRNTYTGIVEWQKRQGNGPDVTFTLGGRRRTQVYKFTEKLNSPVQGTGIDGLKAGIALCYERRNQITSLARPVAFVHDEILMEAPEQDAQDVSLWIQRNMEEGMRHFLKVVPTVAEPKVADNWGEK